MNTETDPGDPANWYRSGDGDSDWSWPSWKFGLNDDSIKTELWSSFNTLSVPLLDAEAFHHDVYEIAIASSDKTHFLASLERRRDQRQRELNDCLRTVALALTASPQLLWGRTSSSWYCKECRSRVARRHSGSRGEEEAEHKDPDLGGPGGTDATEKADDWRYEQWGAAVRFFQTRSYDSVVRYFSSFLEAPSARPENKGSREEDGAPTTPSFSRQTAQGLVDVAPPSSSTPGSRESLTSPQAVSPVSTASTRTSATHTSTSTSQALRLDAKATHRLGRSPTPPSGSAGSGASPRTRLTETRSQDEHAIEGDASQAEEPITDGSFEDHNDPTELTTVPPFCGSRCFGHSNYPDKLPHPAPSLLNPQAPPRVEKHAHPHKPQTHPIVPAPPLPPSSPPSNPRGPSPLATKKRKVDEVGDDGGPIRHDGDGAHVHRISKRANISGGHGRAGEYYDL